MSTTLFPVIKHLYLISGTGLASSSSCEKMSGSPCQSSTDITEETKGKTHNKGPDTFSEMTNSGTFHDHPCESHYTHETIVLELLVGLPSAQRWLHPFILCLEFDYIDIWVGSNYLLECNFGDVIWGLAGLFRRLLQETCSARHRCVCAVASGSKVAQCSAARWAWGTSGSGGWYPEIGDRPSKVLSNPPKKVLSNPKRFCRTPFWPPKNFHRTPVQGFQNPTEKVRGFRTPQKRFDRTFRIEPPLFRLPF